MNLLRFFFTAVCVKASFLSYGQEINTKYHPDFFSLKAAKFSLGVGIESGLSPTLMINASNPQELKVVYKDPREGKTTTPFLSYGFVFDLYSANSILGLLSGLDFTEYSQGFQSLDNTVDFLTIDKVEIPLFLKFRPGLIDGRSHLWFLLGGSYSIPLTCKREQFNLQSPYNTFEDDNKEQLSSNFSLSGSIGYEIFSGEHKNFRIAIYSRVNYPMGSDINTTYSGFQNGGGGVLSSYPSYDIREYRITLGIKFMFRFGEALTIMGNSLKSNL